MSATVVTNNTSNIRAAVYEFLKTFAVPKVPDTNIIWGNQNNLAMPETDDFIIFSPSYNVRHGSGVEEWSFREDTVDLYEQVEMVMQCDFYACGQNGGDGYDAMLRAQAIETVCRSSIGCKFFADRGFGLLYCEDARNTTGVGDSELYDPRWTVNLHLSFKSRINVSQDYFEAAAVDLVNVDVKFKPDGD